MAGSATTAPAYDTSQVGTPYQEFVKSLGPAAYAFDTVYKAVSPSPIDQAVAQPAPTQPAPAGNANGLTVQGALLYGGLGLAAIAGVVVLVKALT